MTDRKEMRFGPAGNSERFYEEGYKRTVDTFAWQQQLGLNAFEYPFGRGISLSEGMAVQIGQAAREQNVFLSAHAPYYINLGSPSEETQRKAQNYILRTARLLQLMGGQRIVLHVGAPGKEPRDEAFARCKAGLLQARQMLLVEGLEDIRLCPETMGRPSVIGTLEEVLQLVLLDDSFIPCIDFAHLHAAEDGLLRDGEAFMAVLDRIEEVLGLERACGMHGHFSHIEYGLKGEIRHRVFDDPGFGPDFAHLAPLLAERGYHMTLICESRGTMADDAARMRSLYMQAHQALQ